jgi:hypothetical protein
MNSQETMRRYAASYQSAHRERPEHGIVCSNMAFETSTLGLDKNIRIFAQQPSYNCIYQSSPLAMSAERDQ